MESVECKIPLLFGNRQIGWIIRLWVENDNLFMDGEKLEDVNEEEFRQAINSKLAEWVGYVPELEVREESV